MGRRPVAVKKYIEEKLGLFLNNTTKIEEHSEYEITTRPFWPSIQGQFNQDEQKLFLYHWGRTVGQFQNDVLPTEEGQIIDLIKFDLLASRCLQDQQTSATMVTTLQAQVDREKSKPTAEQDQELVFQIERQIGILRAARDAQSRDFKDYQDRKLRLYEKMKATRDQRFDSIEKLGDSFPDFVVRLLKNPAYADQLSIEMEKMRIAAQCEKEKLMDFHQYAVGEIDRIILSAESIKLKSKDKIGDTNEGL